MCDLALSSQIYRCRFQCIRNLILRTAAAIVSSLLGVVSIVLVGPSSPLSAATCQETGEGCAVGMVGPSGGIIFYDAGSQQWWGRFLEAERSSSQGRSAWGLVIGYGAKGNTALQRQTMAIGMGRLNTAAMLAAGSQLAREHVGASTNWYLPSKDELDALYNFWKLNPSAASFGAVPVWTSSESEDLFAWYQLFHDGTQFTDANGIVPRLKTNKFSWRSEKHVGSDFASAPMHVIRVRSFPYGGGRPPALTLVTAPTSNPSCSVAATSCRIGDIGPGGGIVVYDAGSNQSWGRYLEIAPKNCEISRVAYSPRSTGSLFPTAVDRVRSKFIGQGKVNTQRLVGFVSSGSAAAVAQSSKCGGLSDWFLPSKDELNEAFRWLSHSRKGLQLTPVGGFERGYYWTSSDYNGQTAWSQYFADGQQFDRVQTLTGNKKPPARPFLVRPMRAFIEGGVTAPAELVMGKSIEITGSRTGLTTSVLVEGTATGFAPGTNLQVWIRFPGQVEFMKSSLRTVFPDGSFTWSRKTGKRIAIYVTAPDETRSNTVIIQAQ